MRKIFWAVTVLFAALTVGCQKNPSGATSSTPKFSTFVEDKTVYFGQLYGEGSGFYTLTLTNADGDELRIDCFSGIALNANSASLASGTYNVGSIAEHALRTFVPAAAETDEVGTILWRKGNATLIDGGSMTVTKSGSNLKFVFNFTSNGAEVAIEPFEGAVKFTNKEEYPPRTEEPNPRVATSIIAEYYGKANDPDAEGGLFLLAMTCQGDINSSSKNLEGIQINGFMPLQEDHNALTLPEGTYTIEQGLTEMIPFKLIEGSILNNSYSGTCEFLTNNNSEFTHGWCILEGTMTVAKNGENYKITTNFIGYRADQSGIVAPDRPEEVRYVYEGPIEINNSADPGSNITGNKELGTITNKAMLQTSDQGSGVMGYFYYIWGDGIDVSISGQNITPSGQGDMLVLGLFGPKTLGDRPEATFVMGDIFGVVYEDKNIAMPANPLPLSQGISPLEGCWYTYLRTTSNAATLDYWAGAMPSVGSVTTSNDGDIHKVVVDFVDRNGNKITGTYEGELLDNGSAAGGFYMPSFPISAELANPVLRAYRK